MAAASPDVVVRQWFREVWDDGNEEAIDRLLAPHAIVHGLGPTPMTGPAAFKSIFRVFRERSATSRSRSSRPSSKGSCARRIAG